MNWNLKRALGLMLIPILLTAGCNRGLFAPGALAQAEVRDNYHDLAKSYTITDNTFEVNRLGTALLVTVLNYSPDLETAAKLRWPNDPVFKKESAEWARPSGGQAGRPVVVLMGLYTPDLRSEDVMKTRRFRPFLEAGGRKLAPARLKEYGRVSKFITDYFPVFSPWETVYLVEFPPASGPLNFLLEWPGGVQSLDLPEKAEEASAR